MANDITTTRGGPAGGLQTTVPGLNLAGVNNPSIVPQNMGGLDAFLLDLARRKVAAQNQAPAAVPGYAAAPARHVAGSGDYGEAKDPHEGWSKAPEEEISRVVPDPFANPYTKMATGFDPGARKERLINGKWEFSDLRPQGGGGGFQGGGAESTLHPSDQAWAQGRVPSATGAPDNTGEAADVGTSREEQRQNELTGSSRLPGMRRAPIVPAVRPSVGRG